MKRNKFIIAFFLFALFSCHYFEKARTPKQKFRDYSAVFPGPTSEKNKFSLSQDYPDTFSTTEKYPWTSIDFQKDYKGYMQSVLSYCIEGNIEVDFKCQKNAVRKWYHAPWLDYGQNGREYHHGLTRERPVPPFELASGQNGWLENWAVGFYNAPGGYTIGKVWNSDTIPSLSLASFPEGTVSFKLLFTTGNAQSLPFLKGSKEWIGNIYLCNPDTCKQKDCGCRQERKDAKLTLLQVDIAVKDSRANPSGWVFGTFIYDASQNGKSVWDRLVPVGLMYGDDSNVATLINKEGAFVNTDLKETVLNPYLVTDSLSILNPEQAYMSHHGLGGRLNGPVDNPISSCVSCHSKAAVMENGSPAPLANFSLTRPTFTLGEFSKYFGSIPSGSGPLHFNGKVFNKLDYSLQLAVGIRNFYQSKIDLARDNLSDKSLYKIQIDHDMDIDDLPEISRGDAGQ